MSATVLLGNSSPIKWDKILLLRVTKSISSNASTSVIGANDSGKNTPWLRPSPVFTASTNDTFCELSFKLCNCMTSNPIKHLIDACRRYLTYKYGKNLAHLCNYLLTI